MLLGRVTVPTEMMPTGLHCELRLLREVATVTPMHLWQMSTQSPSKQRSGQCPHLSHSPGRCVCDGSVSVPHTRDPACLVSARCVLTFGVWAFSCPGVRGIWTRSTGVVQAPCPSACTRTCACVSAYARGTWGRQSVLTGHRWWSRLHLCMCECLCGLTDSSCWLLFFRCLFAARRRAECTVLLVMVCGETVIVHPGAVVPGQDCVCSGYIQSMSLRVSKP